MATPRVINLDALPPDARAHLVGGLPHAFASKPVRAKGLGIGITLIVVWMLAYWFHTKLVRHEGHKLYSPMTFIVFGLIAWLAVVPIVAYIRMKRSLGRAPNQGVYLIGANLVLATEHSLAIFPFAQAAVVRTGTAVAVTCFGQLYVFDFPDGRSFATEQQIKNNANALAHATYYNDQQTVAALDPFAAIAAHAPPRGIRSAWLLAVPGLLLALPITYLLDRMTDDGWYTSLSDSYGPYDYASERYVRSGGRHVTEVKENQCNAQMALADTPPAIQLVMSTCPSAAAKGTEKLDNLYTKARAQLESQPAKAQPVLLELLDASRKGDVPAKFVVHGPTHADLAAIDKLLDKAKLPNIVRLADSFDPAALEHRETQLRDAIIVAINGLAPSATFRILDKPDPSPGLTIDMAYTLTPLVKGNDVIVYHETDVVSPSGRRFLGLTIHIDLTLQTAKGTKYAVSIDAAPPMSISNDQYASTKAIYNNLVDSALAEVTPKLKATMFPTR